MKEFQPYVKNKDISFDEGFREKKRYGQVWYGRGHLFIKKGFKWYGYPIYDAASIRLEDSSRQLRQCCGAPIYKEKMLRITFADDEHLYVTVEETENGDLKQSEKLLKKIMEEYPDILIQM